MPFFSIIIPAYNAEAYLKRCLDSILSQDFSDCEIIVIDDGSTDGTPALLAQYPSVKVITQTNHGMATARNRGMEMAQGEYVMFVDSDDRLYPGALDTLAKELQGEDILSFGTKIYNESTGKTTNCQPSTANCQCSTGWDYFNRHRLEATPVHFVCIWQRVYRRAFLEKHSLHFADGLRRAEDDLFTTMAMLHAQSVKTIPDCLYIYHVRQGSITRTVDPKLEADSRQVQQTLADTFLPLEGIDKHVIYQVLASNYITRLLSKGATLTDIEWIQFRQVCVTPRHRRLYCIAHISPSLLLFYNKLCSSLR